VPDVQIVSFDLGGEGSLSMVFTFVIADLPIGIVLNLLHQNCSPDISSLQYYSPKLGWKLKHLIGTEHCLSSAMHVQVLSEDVLFDSSVNGDSSPGELEVPCLMK
jgi:hypothetical protein